MSRRFTVLLVILGLLGLLGGAIASFPAARAVAWGAPAHVDAAGVSGTVWAGRADRVAFGGPAPVENLSWQLASWQLLSGRLAGEADFRLAGLAVDGRFAAMSGGRVAVRDATLEGAAAPLAELAPVPVLAVDGEVLARIEEAVLEQRRPRKLQGRFQWREARIIAPVQMELGEVRGNVTPDDSGGHVLQLDSSGGQVVLDGSVELAGDGRYRVDVSLTPAADAPARIADTLGMFARREGEAYVIRQSGRLPQR